MKRLITFCIIITTSLMLSAQGIIIENVLMLADFEGDPEARGYSLTNYNGEDPDYEGNLQVVANPAPDDLNESDSVFVFARIDDGDSWSHQSHFTLTFDDKIVVGDRNFIRLKVYSPDRNTGMRAYFTNEGEAEGNQWMQMIAQCNGQWAYANFSLATVKEFDQITIVTSDEWGTTRTPGVVFIDDIEMYNERYEYQEPFMDMVYYAEPVDEEMDIDGLDLEDVWLDTELADISKINDGDGAGIGGKFAAAWDADFLYLFFEVDDNVVWRWSDADWAFWKGDGFQVYMDILGRRIDGRTFGNMNGVGVCPDLESSGAIEAGQGFRTLLPFGEEYNELAQQGSIITGTGYTVEVAWPWKGIAHAAGGEIEDPVEWVAQNVKPGLVIAFDVQLNDDDGAGRVNMLSWASEPKEPHGNSGTWGGLELGGDVTGVNQEQLPSGLLVYPSMAKDLINIVMPNLAGFEIFDITGRSVVSVTSEGNSMQYDVSGLKQGMYLIRATDGLNKSVTRFIKQ